MLQYEQIAFLCEQLRLPDIAVNWQSIADKCSREDASFGGFLLSVLQHEQAHRDERSQKTLTRMAGFRDIVKSGVRTTTRYLAD